MGSGSNLEPLSAAAQDMRYADVDSLADHLLSVFGPREDDIALIAARRT